MQSNRIVFVDCTPTPPFPLHTKTNTSNPTDLFLGGIDLPILWVESCKHAGHLGSYKQVDLIKQLTTKIIPTWRIIPLSKWLVTPTYMPWMAIWRMNNPILRGQKLTIIINHLWTGMILQVVGIHVPFSHRDIFFVFDRVAESICSWDSLQSHHLSRQIAWTTCGANWFIYMFTWGSKWGIYTKHHLKR